MNRNFAEIYQETVLPMFREWIGIMQPEIVKGTAFPLLRARDHGIDHSVRVAILAIAMYRSGGHPNACVEQAICLAAFLHDAAREQEYGDEKHGRRAAGRYLSRWCWILTPDRPFHPWVAQAIAYHGEKQSIFEDAGLICRLISNADRLDRVRLGEQAPDHDRMYRPTPVFPCGFYVAWIDPARQLLALITLSGVLSDLGLPAKDSGESIDLNDPRR